VVQRVFGALGDSSTTARTGGNQANTLVMQMQMVANGYLAFTITARRRRSAWSPLPERADAPVLTDGQGARRWLQSASCCCGSRRRSA
jgi:hypothetical protein